MFSRVEERYESWLDARQARLRDYFGLSVDTELLGPSTYVPWVTPQLDAHLEAFNLEWHLIPSASSVPFDDRYCSRMYKHAPKTFTAPLHHGPSLQERLGTGHRRHQGRIIAVETTMKPRHLPGYTQFYGSAYGFDRTADPLRAYLDGARLGGTRYGHNYLELTHLVEVITDDWQARNMLPAGYRATICPPVVFNLIGSVFHAEWSETGSLELGAYHEHDGAQCYAVGPTEPRDFSYVHAIETSSDWKPYGFRIALEPMMSSREHAFTDRSQQ